MDTQAIKLAAVVLLSPIALGAPIPEPDTIFYGRVLVRSGGQDHQLSAGALSWSIAKGDGSALVFDSQLESLAGGRYSYQLKVPHEAAAGGRQASGLAVPLELNAKSHQHLIITVNGRPATIVVPGEKQFSLEQARRARTFRLDLRVDLDLHDSDGDGIADWWEDAHGLDSQLASDAQLDADGDGLNNLAEFLAGTDPNGDNRRPELLTGSLLAYADGVTGILLQSSDTDSAPENITYTLTGLPDGGTLVLREPDGEVAVGTHITQAELNRGRLVYLHEGGEPEAQEFTVSLRDEDPAHQPSAGMVELEIYRPSETALAGEPEILEADFPEKQWRLHNYRLSRDEGLTIWDRLDAPTLLNLDLSGSVRSHVISGGSEDDELAGGEADDHLWGSGGDDTLRGGTGADTFHYPSAAQGEDTILDFNVAEGDALDLRLALDGPSSLASDYVTLDGERLGIDRDGDGSGFTDLAITLAGNDFRPHDLRRLLDGGHLLLGGPGLPPLVSLESLVAEASENDTATPGEFSITRSGPLDADLWVQLIITGSATNGVDYSLVDSLVRIPAGERSITRRIVPHLDAITEPSEVVEVRVAAHPDYEISESAPVQVAILDLLPQITLEALKPLATVSPPSPGAFLINRSAVLDRSVLVRLTISGTAANGVDYETLSSFVNLPPWESTAVIDVIPKARAGAGEESSEPQSVVLALDENSAYRIGATDAAQVIIVDRATTLEVHLASASESPERLLDYGFPTRSGTPRTSYDGRSLRLEFNRNWSATDLQYVVEVSEDLNTWHHGPAFVRNVTPPARLEGEVNRQIFETANPLRGAAQYFMRVRLERK